MNVPEVKESHVQGSKDNEYTDGLNNNNEQSGSSRNDTSKNVNESVTRKGLEEKGHLSLDEESNLGNSKCQLLDSGHFTISPETEQSESAFSGSPRSHSPPCEVIHTQTSMSQMYPSSLGYSEASDTEGLTHEEIDSICTSMKSGRPASSCTSSVSMSAYRPGSANYGESAEYLRTALNNFNAMYEEKLKIIEDIRAQGDAVAKESLAEKRAHILECWAKDVSVQNIVLIHTVEELEKQSEQKLIQLQKKLKESTNIAQMHHSVIHKYESKIKTLMTDKETSEVEYKALQRDLEKLRSDFKKARDRCRILEKDNENLVTLILRIRDMGVWDTAGLQLWRKTYEQIFGLYPNLPGSEVQTVFTREKAKKIKETEEKAEQLENEVVELEAQREVTAAEILNKDSKISELAEELKMVCTKLQNCQTECEHYKKSLIETQEQLLEATKELQVLSTEVSKQNLQASKESNRQSEIHELLREIRDMKNQLNLSVDEHLSAKEENHLIRKEVSERLQAMCESQQCLHSELSHTIEAKHQVQEKEMELMKTREQMQLYQTKYNSAEQQLATKDQLIEELQKQIVHLNGKGSSSKCGHGHKHVSQPFPRCSRDATSHKTDKDLPSPEENSKTKVMYDRPPWNHHFVKEELLRSKSTLSFNSSGLNFSTNPTPKSSTAVDEKKECDKGLCSSSNEKCRQAYNDAKHSKTQLNLEESTYSFCSCAEIDPSGTCSSPLLPLSTSDENVKQRKKLNYTEEPLNMPEPKRNQKSTSKTQLIGSLAKDKVSVANKASYGLLMDVVVGTSKKFLEASKDLDPQHCLSSIKIIASHSKRKNGLEGEMRTASTEQLKLNLEHRDKCESSTSMEQILSQLPEQTNFNGVTEWIAKSQSSQSKSATKLTTNKQEASRMTKTPEGFGKKTASKIPKPTKPKLSPRRPSPPTRAKKILVTKPQDITDKNNTDNPKLTSKISNIKEEWNRVFSHFNSNNGEEVDGGSYVKDSSESLNSEKVSLSEHCTEEAFMPGGCVVTVRRESSTNLSPDSDEYKRIVDLARKDFEAEKHRIEEEHRKVMKDKDIEITMQKVTIQHLQDALVAVKRGVPIPVPQTSTSVKPANNNGSNGVNSGKVYEI